MAITLATQPQEIGIASDDGFRVRLLGWYSNVSDNTATVHVKEEVTFIDANYTHYYGSNKNYTLNFNGTSSAQYPNQMALNSPVDMAERTQSDVDGGNSISASASWYSYNYGTINCGLKNTVRLPVFSLPPSGLALSNIRPAAESIEATVSVSNWNGGSASTRYRELSVCTGQSASQRKKAQIHGDTMSSALAVDNTSTLADGAAFTITPNTRFYLTMWASNGLAGTGNADFAQVVTAAAKPTVAVESIEADTVTLSYSTPTDGGFYDKTIEWSDDEGATWNTAAIITGGSAAQGTFTITGLTTGEHTVLVRSRTASGSDGNVTVTFNIAGAHLIASDGTLGREATRILVPVNGVATEGSRVLVSHNGIATESA